MNRPLFIFLVLGLLFFGGFPLTTNAIEAGGTTLIVIDKTGKENNISFNIQMFTFTKMGC